MEISCYPKYIRILLQNNLKTVMEKNYGRRFELINNTIIYYCFLQFVLTKIGLQ